MTRESMETRPKKWISQADTGHEGDQIKKPLCGTDPPVRGRGSELLLDPFRFGSFMKINSKLHFFRLKIEQCKKRDEI